MLTGVAGLPSEMSRLDASRLDEFLKFRSHAATIGPTRMRAEAECTKSCADFFSEAIEGDVEVRMPKLPGVDPKVSNSLKPETNQELGVGVIDFPERTTGEGVESRADGTKE
jgi:hypothetical protein